MDTQLKLTINSNKKRVWQGGNSQRDREDGHTIVYLEFAEETVLDDFINRTSRPHEAVKEPLKELLDKKKFDTRGMRWSARAGCSSCPCSPGFILPFSRGRDIFVKVEGIKPRTNDEEAASRLIQLANDPTVPTLSANTITREEVKTIVSKKSDRQKQSGGAAQVTEH